MSHFTESAVRKMLQHREASERQQHREEEKIRNSRRASQLREMYQDSVRRGGVYRSGGAGGGCSTTRCPGRSASRARSLSARPTHRAQSAQQQQVSFCGADYATSDDEDNDRDNAFRGFGGRFDDSDDSDFAGFHPSRHSHQHQDHQSSRLDRGDAFFACRRGKNNKDFEDALTLRKALSLPLKPAPFRESALIIIDAQNTYTEGPLKLRGVERAINNIAKLLQRAREMDIPVIHIQHDAGSGSAYDVHGHSGAIVPQLTPIKGEIVIVKKFPSAFEGTTLQQELSRLGCKTNLILVGFMTHMCINSTARAAFNHQFTNVTVIADCTATRCLPNPATGDVVDSVVVQNGSLAAMNDLPCNVVRCAADVLLLSSTDGRQRGEQRHGGGQRLSSKRPRHHQQQFNGDDEFDRDFSRKYKRPRNAYGYDSDSSDSDCFAALRPNQQHLRRSDQHANRGRFNVNVSDSDSDVGFRRSSGMLRRHADKAEKSRNFVRNAPGDRSTDADELLSSARRKDAVTTGQKEREMDASESRLHPVAAVMRESVDQCGFVTAPGTGDAFRKSLSRGRVDDDDDDEGREIPLYVDDSDSFAPPASVGRRSGSNRPQQETTPARNQVMASPAAQALIQAASSSAKKQRANASAKKSARRASKKL